MNFWRSEVGFHHMNSPSICVHYIRNGRLIHGIQATMAILSRRYSMENLHKKQGRAYELENMSANIRQFPGSILYQNLLLFFIFLLYLPEVNRNKILWFILLHFLILFRIVILHRRFLISLYDINRKKKKDSDWCIHKGRYNMSIWSEGLTH